MKNPSEVKRKIEEAIEAKLAPVAGKMLEDAQHTLREVGVHSAVEVEVTGRVRVEVPVFPDPEVEASLRARGTWDGNAVKVDVLSKAIRGRLIPEGA